MPPDNRRQTSMRLVAAREVDASAIDSQVLAVSLRDDPSVARSLHVVDTLGPSTIPPISRVEARPARAAP